jgi:hypothetical protein
MIYISEEANHLISWRMYQFNVWNIESSRARDCSIQEVQSHNIFDPSCYRWETVTDWLTPPQQMQHGSEKHCELL